MVSSLSAPDVAAGLCLARAIAAERARPWRDHGWPLLVRTPTGGQVRWPRRVAEGYVVCLCSPIYRMLAGRRR